MKLLRRVGRAEAAAQAKAEVKATGAPRYMVVWTSNDGASVDARRLKAGEYIARDVYLSWGPGVASQSDPTEYLPGACGASCVERITTDEQDGGKVYAGPCRELVGYVTSIDGELTDWELYQGVDLGAVAERYSREAPMDPQEAAELAELAKLADAERDRLFGVVGSGGEVDPLSGG